MCLDGNSRTIYAQKLAIYWMTCNLNLHSAKNWECNAYCCNQRFVQLRMKKRVVCKVTEHFFVESLEWICKTVWFFSGNNCAFYFKWCCFNISSLLFSFIWWVYWLNCRWAILCYQRTIQLYLYFYSFHQILDRSLLWNKL